MRPARWLWPALLAVAVVLLILRPWAGDNGAPASDGVAPGESAPHPVTEAEALYEEAIGDLETAFRSVDAPDIHAAMAPERDALDAAIAESRRRVGESPQDEEAQESLLENLRRKLDLFHNTLMLMRDMERGDSATAQDRIDAISGRERPDTG